MIPWLSICRMADVPGCAHAGRSAAIRRPAFPFLWSAGKVHLLYNAARELVYALVCCTASMLAAFIRINVANKRGCYKSQLIWENRKNEFDLTFPHMVLPCEMSERKNVWRIRKIARRL